MFVLTDLTTSTPSPCKLILDKAEIMEVALLYSLMESPQ